MSVACTVDLGRRPNKIRITVRGRLDPMQFQQFEQEFRRLVQGYKLTTKIARAEKIGKKQAVKKNSEKESGEKQSTKDVTLCRNRRSFG